MPTAAVLPTKQDIIDDLNTLADTYGVPRALVQATAQTETSNYDINATNTNTDKTTGQVTSTDWGLMQINDGKDGWIGKQVNGPDGTPFTITDSVKSNWEDNANAGVAILARDYKAAVSNQGADATADSLARETYCRYNGGDESWDRYLYPEKYPNSVMNDEYFSTNYYALTSSGPTACGASDLTCTDPGASTAVDQTGPVRGPDQPIPAASSTGGDVGNISQPDTQPPSDGGAVANTCQPGPEPACAPTQTDQMQQDQQQQQQEQMQQDQDEQLQEQQQEQMQQQQEEQQQEQMQQQEQQQQEQMQQEQEEQQQDQDEQQQEQMQQEQEEQQQDQEQEEQMNEQEQMTMNPFA